MIIFATAIICGTLPLLFLPVLPAAWVLVAITGTALGLFHWGAGICRVMGWSLLAFCWAALNAKQVISKTDIWTRGPLYVIAEISDILLRESRIRVKILQVNQTAAYPPLYAWITLHQDEEYCPGQRFAMRLKLRPVQGLLNEGGVDSQRNALSKMTPFQGQILHQTRLTAQCSLRDRLLDYAHSKYPVFIWRNIIDALLFGERAAIPPEISTLFRHTGIAHLMAISGMHIGLMFGIGWIVCRWVQKVLPAIFGSYQLPIWVGWLLSVVYCWLSGVQPSALRAVTALSFWIFIRQIGINLNSGQILLLCIALLLVMDPLMILSDSLWLSVIAVTILLIWYRWFPLHAGVRQRRRWYLLRLLYLQIGITLLMLPIQIFMFGGISLAALSANLVAIPLVTAVILPLATFAMLPGTGYPGDYAIRIIDQLMDQLILFLQAQGGWWLWLSQPGYLGITLWGGLLILRCIVLTRFPIHTLSFGCSLLCAYFAPRAFDWRIDMLDVGQGLAVMVTQGRETLIYDTGKRWQNADAGERMIIPWLRYHRFTPYKIILSHRHLDHTGGLQSLKQQWPKVPVAAAYPLQGREPCQRGQKWQWHRLSIEVLWPLSVITKGKNNDSCVVRISDGKYRLLLTGDLEKQAERAMAALEKDDLQSTWLQVPHHGSRTSSTPLFLRKVNAEIWMASVARYNAWRFPSVHVLKNYRDSRTHWYDTAISGQINLRVTPDNYMVLQMRDHISPRWYHQWFGIRPDSR